MDHEFCVDFVSCHFCSRIHPRTLCSIIFNLCFSLFSLNGLELLSLQICTIYITIFHMYLFRDFMFVTDAF